MSSRDAPDVDRTLTLERITRLYRPAGVRRGILLPPETSESDRCVAAQCVAASGESPERRLAILHPRLGNSRVSEAEWIEFLSAYGHEYALVWFPRAMPHAVQAAARGAGCVVYDGL